VGTALSAPLPLSREEYLGEWARLHGDAPTRGLVGFWLGGAYRAARPLARAGVGPDAVTLVALLVALGAAGCAAGGALFAASALVVLSGLLDNLDGAVAVLTGRATRRGFVLDSVADRIADGAYGAALWFAGAPGPLAVAAVAVAWLHEYTRARAAAAGMPEIGVVTVAERPTRVILAALFLFGAALHPSYLVDLTGGWLTGSPAEWASAGAGAWTAVGVVGGVELWRTITRRLR
jgi:phosphatidylglycerophosphate synthase